MRAEIIGTNLPRGRAIALTEDGEYVLIELFTDEPELHDKVIGNFDEHPLGDAILRNVTSSSKMEVYIQDYCNKQIAEEYLKGLR